MANLITSLITSAERTKLYKNVYNQLGYGVRSVQITDEQMDTLFCNSLEDYSKIINEWLIDQQWSTINGLEITETDFAIAYATKDLNYINSFTYAYSKQVGLGANAPSGRQWELKKDFIVLENTKQNYTIPKGRQVNEVLWCTPVSLQYDALNASGWIAGDYGWGFANGSGGMSSLGYVQPVYSTLLASADRAMKDKVMKSDLSYRITGNADGTKNLHLYPIPGGGLMPKGFNSFFSTNVDGLQVWYFYYETSNKREENNANTDNSDISVVVRPSDAPIDNLKWINLNTASKTWIRQYLTATAKYLLGLNRGTYSGNINITDATVQMDYTFLLNDGKEEKAKLEETLLARLDNLSYTKQLEKKALEADNINKALGYVPMKIYTK